MTNRPEYYECHVTLPVAEGGSLLKGRVEPIAQQHRFKVSVLKGDEVMGDDALLYCTSHDKDFDRMFERMEKLIKDLPVDPLRKKIEHVILDVKDPIGDMEIGWWPFDGVDLIFKEGKKQPELTGLEFDTVMDAKWAAGVFTRFIKGQI